MGSKRKLSTCRRGFSSLIRSARGAWTAFLLVVTEDVAAVLSDEETKLPEERPADGEETEDGEETPDGEETAGPGQT